MQEIGLAHIIIIKIIVANIINENHITNNYNIYIYSFQEGLLINEINMKFEIIALFIFLNTQINITLSKSL